jgi:Tfp pilus assembly protein PilF
MQDAHTKAPNSNRAAINLTKEYFQIGELDKALSLAKEAYHLWHPSKNYSEAISLNAQGVAFHRRGDEPKATLLFQQSLQFVPQFSEARKNLIVSLCSQHRYKEALELFFDDTGKRIHRDSPLQAAIQLHLNQPNEALITLCTMPREHLLAVEVATGIGKTLSIMGHYRQADFFLRQASTYSPLAALIRIENFLLAGETENAEIVCQHMFIRYRAVDIFNRINKNDPATFPVYLDLVKPFVLKQIPKGRLT